ncbi:hypothetical protein ACQ4PT_022063 [Festuca glaucescens]
MEGLMRSLKLSEEENRGLKIGWSAGGKIGEVEVQALGKLMSEKPGFANGMARALGQIWCPLKSLRCKDMGGNKFLFTFLQASGKKKALDEGPWMFDHELLVVEDFDPRKSLEEYEFRYIPIWVRILRLPLGMMNKSTGISIGNQVGGKEHRVGRMESWRKGGALEAPVGART